MASAFVAETGAMPVVLRDLQATIDDLWRRVRQNNLYGGRPRNAVSEESVAVARSALALAQESDDPHFLREAHYMMAYALTANEECGEAIPHYRQAITAFDEAGDSRRAGRLRLGFISALSLTGQSRQALEVAREAEQIFRESNDQALLAKLATNLGVVYQRLDNYDRAVQCHFEAAKLFGEIGDEQALAQAYLNLGCALCFQDRFSESEEMFARCEEIAARLNLPDLRAHARYNEAYVYFLSGRLPQALEMYRDAREMFVNDRSRRHAALCDLDEAEIYIQLRLPHDALVLAQDAAQSFAELGLTYEQGKALVFGAVALTQKRQFGDALAAFREAQAVLRQDGNAFWVALVDLYRAEVLFSIGRLWEAHSLASVADAKFAEIGDPAKRLVSQVLLGRVCLGLGRVDEAAVHAVMVQQLAEATKISLFLFASCALLAEIAERQNDVQRACSLYEQAGREIEVRHTHLHHDELGITFYKSKTEVFEALVCLTLTQDESPESVRKAYAMCEKAKAQTFVDALAPHLPSIRSRADERLVSRVERLRGELNGSYLRFRSAFLTTAGSTKREEVELCEDELVRTLTDLSKSDSEYVSLQVASSVRLEDLQKALPRDTTLLEYFFARDEVIAFVISPKHFRVVRHVTPTKRVHFLAGRLQYQIERFSALFPNKEDDIARRHGAADQLMQNFYRELMLPVLPFIETSGLIIVPHGVLHRVPFHASFDGKRYLADVFEISYAPTGSVLNYCFDRPDLISDTPVRAPSKPPNNVLAHFIHAEARVALRHDNPVLSRLEFSDGSISIPDIYASQWQTNLLSICSGQSFTNVSGETEGLLGLLRACLYAGCRSVLLELWKIRHEPASKFFEYFFSQWRAGTSKLQAVSTARRALREEFPHPFDWAPFILAGRR